MTPNPHSRVRYPDDRRNTGMTIRLGLILFFVIVQVTLTIGLWAELNEVKKMLRSHGVYNSESASAGPGAQKPHAKTESQVKQDITSTDTKPVEKPEAEVKLKDLEPAPIRVQVLNGCGTDGIAGSVGKWLEKNGYKVKDVGNADRRDYRTSQIINRSGNMTAARELARLVGIKEAGIKSLDILPKPEFDLTLIVGSDHSRLAIGR